MTPEQIEHFAEVIRTRYPDFGSDGVKHGTNLVSYREPAYGLPYRSKTFGMFPEKITIPQLHGITICCGLVHLSTGEAPVAELTGLYALARLGPVERAIFALWLNDNPDPRYAAIIASSASPDKNKWDATEKCLLEVGFKPSFRSYNLCHGPNYVTFWSLSFSKDVLADMPGLTPPVVKAAVPAVRRVAGLLRRKAK